MKTMYALILIVFLSGCEALGVVNARAEKAMDAAVNLSEIMTCGKISRRALIKKYGRIGTERRRLYEDFCNGSSSEPPTTAPGDPP